MVGCTSHEEAAEFILSCTQRMLSSQGTAAEERERAQQHTAEGASAHLSALWNVEQHAVDFLLAARSLSLLARVTSEESWEQLLLETDGLLDPQLLYFAIQWLQRDQPQLW